VNQHLHPVFSSILNAAFVAPLVGEKSDYIALLRKQDWSFEFADDSAAYNRGRNALAKLREMRGRVDADGAIWNSCAPERYRFGGHPAIASAIKECM
jgi:hypothetical protein